MSEVKYLDPEVLSLEQDRVVSELRKKVIGQDEAIDQIGEVYQLYKANLNPPNRPLGNLLFLGPTGTGKTRVVEAFAETLYGDPKAVLKIDCAEFQHSHEIAKLVGSPPGYLGHKETHAYITQDAVNRWFNEEDKICILLFDEIEKASDALWQLLLGIMDKATLTLGDNRRVDLSSCIVFLTSNLGAGEMNEVLAGSSLGFQGTKPRFDLKADSKINTVALNAAKRKFTPEFMNRIDKVCVFKQLQDANLRQILELELTAIQKRFILSKGPKFPFTCSPEVKERLLTEGTDPKYGARHLKRVLEKYIVYPMARLTATQQIQKDNLVILTLVNGEIKFHQDHKSSSIAAEKVKRMKAKAVGSSKPIEPQDHGDDNILLTE